MKTKNYDLFKFRHANRLIDHGLVSRLKKSIEKIGFIKSRPVLINENFEIIDGQHRFIACKELDMPIYYERMQMNGRADEIIVELNKNQLVWRLEEYIQFYASKGVDCYIKLLQFQKNYKLDPSQSIGIYFGANGSCSAGIKKGNKFNIFEKADDVAIFIKEINIFLPFAKKMHFVRAAVILFIKANETQIKKLFDNRLLIFEQPSVDTYLILFENIINRYNKANKIKLRK